LRQFARLAPGVSIEHAQQELNVLAEQLREQFPDTHRGLGLFVEPLQASLGRHVRAQVLVLQAAALMGLLIALVNLASLAVARSAGRRGEFALRSILVADVWRQWRLLLSESVLLAVSGGLAGLLLASVGLRMLTTLFPQGFANAWDVHLGARTIFAAIAMSGLVAFVIAGAARSALRRVTLADANAQTGARSIGARSGIRLASVLVAGNFALALAVTVASILLLNSHQRLQQVDLGFRPSGVISGGLLLPSMIYPDDADLRGAQQRLRYALEALPGVEAVAFSSSDPLSRSFSDALIRIEGNASDHADGRAHTWMNWVSYDYLDTLGVRLRDGRAFNAADVGSSAKSVIINAAFVRQHFSGQDPLGHRIGVDEEDGTHWFDIVGVVEDVRFFGVDQPQTPTAYFSLEAIPRRNLFLTVRSHAGAATVMASMRQAVRQLDPTLAMTDLRSLQERVDAAIAMPRAISRITVWFALSGLLLAGIGVYSTLAHRILRRTRELGLRRAMGARTGSVLVLVMEQVARPALTGLLLGLPIAWLLARELRDVLYEIGPAQPSAWLTAIAVLTLVALLAAALPVQRAIRVEPLVALRQD
jgi:putative ABC transport system permease protein